MAKVKEAALYIYTQTGNVSFGSISATKSGIVAGMRLLLWQTRTITHAVLPGRTHGLRLWACMYIGGCFLCSYACGLDPRSFCIKC